MNRIIFLLLFFISTDLFSQSSPEQISNIVNAYTDVLAYSSCDNSFEVSDAGAFKAGDNILIIQMKGATVDESDTKHFGSVLNYNNAGNYEFNRVVSTTGNKILLQNKLTGKYDIPDGAVQIVRVATYKSATIINTLTCAPWDGKKGGVLAISVSDILNLKGTIDVSGKGFRGGTLCSNQNGNCGTANTDYFYTVSSGLGAEKGEGICQTDPSKNGGMGAWANGGGGGNKQNSGGGGGGNFTQGGKGGNQTNSCAVLDVGGEGGVEMQYRDHKIFMGGGGGCSDNNDNAGTPGSNGGGIVIIQANEITSNGDSILADGLDVPVNENKIGDGAGGGGAGGVVLINCESVAGNIKIDVNGGSGGNQNNSSGKCFGPGGGGGTGLVILSSKNIFSAVTFTTRPGNPGKDVYANSPCYNSSYGAYSGNIGRGFFFDKTLVRSVTPFVGNKGQTKIFTKTESENITLNAAAGLKYSWSPNANLSSTTVQDPVSNATSNTIYTVQILDAAGACTAVDTFKVFVKKDSLPIAAKPIVKKDTIPVVVSKPIVKKDTIPVAAKPIVKKDTIPMVVSKPIVKKDTIPVAAKPIVKKDTIPMIVSKPIVKKDTILVAAKPIVKKDTIPVVVSKPIVKKDTIPIAAKPIVKKDTIRVVSKPIVKKDTIPLATKPIVKKDTIPMVVSKPIVKKDTIPVAAKPIVKKDTIPIVSKPIVKKDSLPVVVVKPLPPPEVLVTRKDKVESTIFVTGDSLQLTFYDDGIVDGDSISLFLNKQLIFQHLMLTNKPFVQEISLAGLPQENTLTMVAENLGTIPPNTAYIEAKTKKKTYSIYLSSDLNDNATIKLIKE